MDHVLQRKSREIKDNLPTQESFTQSGKQARSTYHRTTEEGHVIHGTNRIYLHTAIKM